MASENTRETPREEWMPFAERLKRALDEDKRPAYVIAKEAGTNSGNLSKLQSAKRGPPTGSKLTQLARVLNVRIEWLVDGEGPMRPGEAVTRSPAVSVEPPTMRHLREVYETYEFPDTVTGGEIWEALQGEAFKVGNAPIGPAHWKRRIDEELAARKGKRIAHVVHDDPVEEKKRARRLTRS